MIGSPSNGNGASHRPRVLVAGALGAVGSLVAELVASHPGLELGAITARDTGDEKSPIGKRLSEIYPEHRVDLTVVDLDSLDLDSFDAAVVAYPAGAASTLARRLLDAELKVIDSCADFRFSERETYEEWYGPHQEPALLGQAVYGLPELNRDQILDAGLVGNPGCYPTASLLALKPLAQAGLIDDVVIDAKSGVSGAGKRGESAPAFVGTFDNMKPYGVPGHRHEPEIAEKLSRLRYNGALSFVPHLVPLDQGELVSCYVTPSRDVSAEELKDLYLEAYETETFVELSDSLPTARDVQRTNICRIYPVLDRNCTRIFVFAVIDNLWKGGASQAVQNLNLVLGIPEGAGIDRSTAIDQLSRGGQQLDRVSVSV